MNNIDLFFVIVFAEMFQSVKSERAFAHSK